MNTRYTDEAMRHPLLSAERERELTLLSQAGDAAATREMIECNLRLVVSISKRYATLPAARSVAFDDVVSEGVLGLFHALRKFDVTRGLRFSTYATWWVKQKIWRYLMGVHVVHVTERSVKIAMAREDGDAPAGESRRRAETARAAMAATRGVMRTSNDWPSKVRDHTDTLADGDEAEARRAAVLRALSTLDEADRRIVALRYGLDGGGDAMTLEQVGGVAGRTKERMRQKMPAILKKLRGELEQWSEKERAA